MRVYDEIYYVRAIAGQASYIVTEDRHFDVLKNVSFPALTTISIDYFMRILQSI